MHVALEIRVIRAIQVCGSFSVCRKWYFQVRCGVLEGPMFGYSVHAICRFNDYALNDPCYETIFTSNVYQCMQSCQVA